MDKFWMVVDLADPGHPGAPYSALQLAKDAAAERARKQPGTKHGVLELVKAYASEQVAAEVPLTEVGEEVNGNS